MKSIIIKVLGEFENDDKIFTYFEYSFNRVMDKIPEIIKDLGDKFKIDLMGDVIYYNDLEDLINYCIEKKYRWALREENKIKIFNIIFKWY